MQTTVNHLSLLRFDLKVLCSELMGFQYRSSEISYASPGKNFVVFLGESLCDATCIYILNHRFLGTPMTMETSIYSLFLMMGSSCRANTNPYRVTILPLAFGLGFGAGAAPGILDPLVIGGARATFEVLKPSPRLHWMLL